MTSLSPCWSVDAGSKAGKAERMARGRKKARPFPCVALSLCYSTREQAG